jgi:predicted lactoylglutathione lyase
MSDFNFNIDDFADSTSFTSKLGESYNPDGSPSLVTSASKDKYSNQTLTSRNLTDIMSGRSAY